MHIFFSDTMTARTFCHYSASCEVMFWGSARMGIIFVVDIGGNVCGAIILHCYLFPLVIVWI